MAEPKPVAALDLRLDAPRPFPKSVPISVQKEALATLGGDPELAKKKVAFVLTPTLEHTSEGWEVSIREAIVLNLNGGWSFAQFTEWRPNNQRDFRAGFEIRKVL